MKLKTIIKTIKVSSLIIFFFSCLTIGFSQEEDKMAKENLIELEYSQALAGYNTLKELEETQEWNKYFQIKDDLMKEIDNSLNKALDLAKQDPANPYSLEAAFLNWTLRKNENAYSRQTALQDLLAMVKDFAQATKHPEPIKDIADKLKKEELETYSDNLYVLYVEKLKVARSSEELLFMANVAVKENNSSLAQLLFGAYLDVFTYKTGEEYIDSLASIIRIFADDGTGLNSRDSEYAEALFKRAEIPKFQDKGLGADLQYLRGYNLERMKDYKNASKQYKVFLTRFNNDKRAQEVSFRLAIIYLYMLNNQKDALGLLEKVIKEPGDTNLVISGLYHLGLYWQYNNDKENARKYYGQIIDIIDKNPSLICNEIRGLVDKRLSEIEEARGIEFNLKNFLDASLYSANNEKLQEQYSVGNVKFYAEPGKVFSNNAVTIKANTYVDKIGCFAQEVRYIWGVDVQDNLTSSDKDEWTAIFPCPGIKVVFLVTSSSSKMFDRDISMVNVGKKDSQPAEEKQ